MFFSAHRTTVNWAEMGSQHTTAGLDSAILGSGEGCSGRGDSGQRLDSARALKFPNLGNENSHVKQYLNGSLPEREDNISLKLTEEILQSMEVGLAFRDYISSLDYHKAASYVVTASDDESIRLYDVSTATCLKTINSKKYGVDLVCFTLHPTTVIYSSKNSWDESLRLLSLNDNNTCGISEDITTGGPFNIFSVGGDMSDANAVRFSNDGRLVLFTTTDGHIHVLDSFRGTLSSRCPELLNRAAAQNRRISGDGLRWDL
ncbi:hypothetical protein OROMI_002851 [Orobanche minor]